MLSLICYKNYLNTKQMRRLNVSCAVIALSSALLFSCHKEEKKKNCDEMGAEEPLVYLKSGYSSNIIAALEKPADFEFYTKGVIEYTKDGNVLAVINYGEGERDSKAIMIKDGKSEEIDLAAKKKKSDYEKVIVKPLVKTNDCNYIVEGTIKYFKGKEWVATIDFGNGNCDDLATKTWKDGSKEFSLSKKK
jgi:hypothetical protein